MDRREFVKKGSLGVVAASVAMPSFSQFLASKNDMVNIGVIGTGDRGGGLISIMNNIPNLNLTACCDVLPFRLESGIAKAKSKVKPYTNYKALLDDKDIDAVIIATPFSTHSAIAVDALNAGKHVYGEKTLAKGFDGIKALNKAQKHSKQLLQTGHQYHSSRLYTSVVEMIQQGKIGKVLAVEAQWNRNWNWKRPVPDPKLERQINWRMYREFSGGLVAELCSHQIDFVNWITGATPLQVMGTGGIDYWKDGRETYDNIHLIYTYPDGVKAKFTCLTANAMGDYQIKVMGDKGTIIMDYDNAWFYPEGAKEDKIMGEVDGVSGATISWEKGKGIPLNIVHTDATQQALIDFGNNIINHKMPETNFVTGAKVSVAVQMALDAIDNNEIIKWEDNFKELYS